MYHCDEVDSVQFSRNFVKITFGTKKVRRSNKTKKIK